jgi:hypothetical protein
LPATIEEQERESDFIDATPVPGKMSGNQKVLTRVVVEVGLPDSGEPDSAKDRKSCLPPFAIVVASLYERPIMGRNYLHTPEPDGGAGIVRCTEVTDLIEVAKPRGSSPKGARTETEKNRPGTA